MKVKVVRHAGPLADSDGAVANGARAVLSEGGGGGVTEGRLNGH